MKYSLVVKNRDYSRSWRIPFASGYLTEELNNDRFASFSFIYEQLEEYAIADNTTPEFILSNGYREVFLYDEDGNLIYSGFLNEYQDNLNEDGGSNITIASSGFFSLLLKRHTDKEKIYSSQDSSDIAWDMIDTTQNLSYGDLGITRGLNPTTKNRDRTFYFESIRDAIYGMSNEKTKDGYDFEIDKDKIFNIYYPEKGQVRSDIILRTGWNINNYSIYRNGILGMCNQVFVLGEGYGADVIYQQEDAENSYKANYGLLQDTLPEKDVIETGTLTDKGQKYLDIYKMQRRTIVCNVFYDNPNWNNYEVGDRIRIIIPGREIDNYYRLSKRVLNLENDKVDLTFKTL